MFLDISLTRPGSWSACFALAAAWAVTGCATIGGQVKAPGPDWIAAPEMEEISDPEKRIAAQQQAITKECLERWNSECAYVDTLATKSRIHWYNCLPVDRENSDKWAIWNKAKRCEDDPGRRECLDACIANPAHIWCDNCVASPHEYRCKQLRCIKNPDLPECGDITIPNPEPEWGNLFRESPA